MTNRPGRFAARLVLLLAGAHFIHDVFTAFLAPVLPLLIEKLDLTLFEAGTLAVLTQIPSFFNPVLGSWIDRTHRHRLFVALGPAGSGTLMCLMGLAPSYGALAILLLTAGISVSGLHVSAPVLIRQVAGDRVGRGMSFFMVGGELARTVGPLIAVQLVATWGLEGFWRAIPVALASSTLLWWKLGQVDIERPKRPPIPPPRCLVANAACASGCDRNSHLARLHGGSLDHLPPHFSIRRRSQSVAREHGVVLAGACGRRGSFDFRHPQRSYRTAPRGRMRCAAC